MRRLLNLSFIASLIYFVFSFCSYAEKNLEQDKYPSSAIWKIEMGQFQQGTGFFISPNLFVTDFHVIQSVPKAFHLDQIILSQEGHSRIIHIKNIQNLSALDDLLLLETKESVTDYLSLEEKTPKSFEELFIIGYPDGQWAKIRQIGKIFPYQDKTLFSFPVNRIRIVGASGSPVLNQKNQVVGVVSIQSYNIIYATKIKWLQKFITKNNRISSIDAYKLIQQEIKNLKELAQKRNPFASYQLAIIYTDSSKYNLDKAFYWLITDINQDYAPALHQLAWLYLKGINVGENIRESFFLEKKAAKQKFTVAQYQLAEMYHKGIGVKKNREKAKELYKKLANQGHMEAQFRLAEMYHNGIGVKKNREKAKELYKKLANQGHMEAQFRLKTILFKETIKQNLKKTIQSCKNVFLPK